MYKKSSALSALAENKSEKQKVKKVGLLKKQRINKKNRSFLLQKSPKRQDFREQWGVILKKIHKHNSGIIQRLQPWAEEKIERPIEYNKEDYGEYAY